MTAVVVKPQADSFFIGNGASARYCLLHRPAGAPRGALLYVHPFAEEMNKSRRMAALQARAFASAGYAVLQIDLHGCGDSAGDFSDASWDSWKADLALAHRHLHEQCGVPVHLWGLRLGATLALDYAAGSTLPLAGALLWQPVVNGKTFFTQFLRLRVASDMIGDAQQAATGTVALRAQLAAGEHLEIAGYEIAPALAAAIDAIDLASLPAPAIPVLWLDAVAAPERPLTPVSTRLAARWREAGGALALHAVVCPAFWATQEITEAPALLAATSHYMIDESAHV